MGRKRNPMWEKKEDRILRIHEIVKGTGKTPRKITKRDFIERGLGSLLNFYKGSPKRALLDAGYDPGPIKHPKGFWEVKENRVQAVFTIMQLTGKESTELRKLDFINNGYSLVVKNRSIETLMEEAGLEYKQYQRESGYWNDPQNRIREVRKLVEYLGKDPSDVTKSDLNANGLSTVLGVHHGSLRAILKEAGYDVVKKKPPKYWNEKENRVTATKGLIAVLDKRARDITRDDFVEAGLHSLLLKYRDELVAEYEKGEIITYDKGYLLRFNTAVERALAEAGLI